MTGYIVISLRKLSVCFVAACAVASAASTAHARDISPPLPERHPDTPRPKIVLKAPGAGTIAVKITGADKASAVAKPQSSLDAAIAPLTSFRLSAPDIKRIKDAFKMVYKGDMVGAMQKRSGIKDPVGRKLVTWYRLRSQDSQAGARQIEDFRLANPDWPDQKRLRRRAEEALFFGAEPPAAIISFFATEPPRYAAGKASLAGAHIAQGRADAALPLIRSAWRQHDLDDRTERAIAKRFAKELTTEDHNWRLNRFLLNDSRYGRPGRLKRAKKVAKYLRGIDRKKADIRLTIWRSYSKRRRSARLKAASKLIKKLPSEGPADWGLFFHKVQMTRRRGRHEEAWKMLLSAPVEAEKVYYPDHWWIERRVNAYDALYRKKYEIAYQIVARTGPLSVNERNESAFMAGWIALRFLNRPKQALEHFDALAQSADGPRSRSRAAYWQGRTYQDLGRQDEARKHFEKSANEFNTFYGQLARQTLKPDGRELTIEPPVVPSQDVIDSFVERDGLKALMIVHQARNRSVMRRFLLHYRRHFKTEQEMVLAAHLAKSLGDTQMAVRTGKTGIGRGFNLARYAYPTHAMPKFKPLRPSPETPMLYALARQESEFNTLITSIAGARGVLQVMGVTARHVCRDYKIKCGSRAHLKRRLSNDPPFNASLASAYIGDRKDEFGGSYILTFAGYNAGPGRARYWIRKNGDPRDPDIDPIDWIELIHIKETRHYVKKVMANLQIYRARLGDHKNALRIRDDIERGAFGPSRHAAKRRADN